MKQQDENRLVYCQTVLQQKTLNRLQQITGEKTVKGALEIAIMELVNRGELKKAESTFMVKWDNCMCNGFFSVGAAERWVRRVFMKIVPDKDYSIVEVI